jgi:hypothetical protein
MEKEKGFNLNETLNNVFEKESFDFDEEELSNTQETKEIDPNLCIECEEVNATLLCIQCQGKKILQFFVSKKK